jgi:hypothetical protein
MQVPPPYKRSEERVYKTFNTMRKSMIKLEIAILLVLIGVCIICDNTRAIGFILLGGGTGMITSFAYEFFKRR